jgi:hypothetical protein
MNRIAFTEAGVHEGQIAIVYLAPTRQPFKELFIGVEWK